MAEQTPKGVMAVMAGTAEAKGDLVILQIED
jgi:hypothetical protein